MLLQKWVLVEIILQVFVPLLSFVANVGHCFLKRDGDEWILWYVKKDGKLRRIFGIWAALIAVTFTLSYMMPTVNELFQSLLSVFFVFINVDGILQRRRNRQQVSGEGPRSPTKVVQASE